MAGKTMVVSLPAEWVKKYGLKKGEEIDLEEAEERIILTSKKSIFQDKITIDITPLNYSLIWRYIFAAYIKGANEIKICYKNEEQKKTALKAIDTLIGFALINEGEDYLVIKDVSGDATEFDNILRRVFLMLSSLKQEGIDAIKGNDKALLLELKEKDYKINYAINFCLRYLNKKGYPNHKKAYILYSTLRSLEFLGDEYSELFKKIVQDKLKIGKEFINILEEVNKMFEDYHKIFYKFENEKALELVKHRDALKNKLEKYLMKASKDDLKVIVYLKTIVMIIFNLMEPKLEEII